jgi:hypothetical protein
MKHVRNPDDGHAHRRWLVGLPRTVLVAADPADVIEAGASASAGERIIAGRVRRRR